MLYFWRPFMKKILAGLLWAISFTLSIAAPAQVITTVAGSGGTGFSGDGGPATSAQFSNPISVAVDASGNMYVADYYNHRLRKIDGVTGIITTIAGNGTAGFSGDGGLAVTAQINNPSDIIVDAAGNIYFVDSQNFRVRKIDGVTGIISTVAGNGMASYAGETILALNAGLYYPNGLAVDANNLYISLFSKQRICKVDLVTGILSTIGGTGANGFSGDGGPAINASFAFPAGLSVSQSGEVYIADYNNNRIRKIDAAGIVTTVAGNGIAAFSGDGILATNASINLPTGVAVDAAGNIFIADRNNARIRKVTASTGIIATVAGSGNYGFGGDGSAAISPCVKLADPHKVRLDATGNMFISDQSNNRIRKVDLSPPGPGLPTISISTSPTTVCSSSPVIFSSAITNGGANPVYQWKKNGIATGTNNPSYSSSTLNNGDIITCELTVTAGCGPLTVISNAVTITVNTTVVPNVSISSGTTSICQGNAVTFTAVSLNGGTAPFYQWQVNGNNSGTNSAVYTNNTLSNGDVVRCVLTSNANCASSPVISNTIAITVSPVVTPAVSITASAVTICSGSAVTFTAVPTNSGTNTSYQWKINNSNAGTNNPVFISSSLLNNDIITCSIIADPTFPCLTTGSAVSNPIVITVSIAQAPAVSIIASDNLICPKTPVTFTATPQNEGTVPSYTWKLNGNISGTNNTVYTNSNLANGDQVNCVLSASNTACPAVVSSNIITMQVKSLPVISISPVNALVLRGSQVQLTTTVTGSVGSYQWLQGGLLVNPFTLNPLTKPLDSTTSFVLSLTNDEGCTINQSVEIKVYGILLMPSAFTPNKDGINDVFRIPPNVQLTLSDFSIYDRWGNRVFTTTDITRGWDGTYSGAAFNTGVFAYIISGESQGKKVFIKGSFTLLR
jgi:gliding motility-associated-like protein